MGITELVFGNKEINVNVRPLNSHAVLVETDLRNKKNGIVTKIGYEEFQTKKSAIDKFSSRKKMALIEATAIDALAVISLGYGLIDLFAYGINQDSSYICLGLILFRVGLQFGNNGVIAHTQEEAVSNHIGKY